MKLIYSLYSALRHAHAAIPYIFGSNRALPPLRITLEITYRCNLRCQMCYLIHQKEIKAKNGSINQKQELTTAEIKRLIGQLPPLSFLTFTGGEPLLRSDILELLAHAARRNQTALITNGFLMNQETADAIVGIRPRVVAISIDGLEETHDQIRGVAGSFRKARQALLYLRQAKNKKGQRFPLLEIKTVITQANVNQLSEIYRLAGEIGVDSFVLQMLSTSINMNGLFLSKKPTMMQKPDIIPDFPIESLKNQLHECQAMATGSPVNLRIIPPVPITEVIKHYGNETDLADYYCRWPWSVTRISAFGDVFPCYNMLVGNIREEHFLKVWNGRPYRTFRRSLRRQRIFPGCHGCCMLEYGQK